MEQEWVYAGWFSLERTLAQTRGPTDSPKDQGLAHRQTWGSIQRKLPHALSHSGPHRDFLPSLRPRETDFQINELRWTFRHFGLRETLRKLDPQTSSQGALTAVGVVG